LGQDIRKDLKLIFDLIENNSRVLDLGCGDGTLLSLLSSRKHSDVMGIEIDREKVALCISKGLNVVQSDVNEALNEYQNDSFDYIILSITLQEIEDPSKLISEMLRIGKNVIISIKNLANWVNRFYFLIHGEIPYFKNTRGNYSSTGISLSNIHSFKKFCKKNNFKIFHEIYIPLSQFNKFPIFRNIFSDIAIFTLKKYK